jgi:hypothetical protein
MGDKLSTVVCETLVLGKRGIRCSSELTTRQYDLRALRYGEGGGGYLKLGALTEEVMASTIVVSTSLTSEDKFYTRE